MWRGARLLLFAAACRVNFDYLEAQGPDDAASDVSADLGPDAANGCIAQLAVGDDHACVRLVNGALWCWGDNTYGNLGNGTTSTGSTPPALVLPGPYREIALGRTFTCAVAMTNEVYCWGRGSEDALGPASGTDKPTPQLFTGLVAATLHLSGSHGCAFAGSQGLCWGDGDGGQFGDNTAPDKRMTAGPIGFPSAQGFAWLAVGEDASCGKALGASLSCWGINGHGELGVDPTTTTMTCKDKSDNMLDCSPVPIAVPAFVSTSILQASVGGTHACAVDINQKVACWGENASGQLGDGTQTSRFTPMYVPGLPPATSVHAGHEHTCALLADQTVSCWGQNNDGELGDGSVAAMRPLPGLVLGLTGVTQVSVGSDGESTCALASDGVYCWGENIAGIAGMGGTNVTLPMKMLARCP